MSLSIYGIYAVVCLSLSTSVSGLSVSVCCLSVISPLSLSPSLFPLPSLRLSLSPRYSISLPPLSANLRGNPVPRTKQTNNHRPSVGRRKTEQG